MLWLYNMTVTTRCSKKRQVLNKLQNSSLEQSYEAKQSKQVPLQKILVLLLLANVCRVKNPDKSSYLRSSLQKSEEIYIYMQLNSIQKSARLPRKLALVLERVRGVSLTCVHTFHPKTISTKNTFLQAISKRLIECIKINLFL